MKSTELLHGDVLCYEHATRAKLMVRGIRLIEGNKLVHTGIVRKIDGKMFVLQQLFERQHCYLPFYYPEMGEVIHCYRPKFVIVDIDEKKWFRRESYGYLCLADELINHMLGRLTLKHWQFKPLLQNFFNYQHCDCSVMVAEMLDLETTTKWCRSNRIVEPDDYSLHPRLGL